MGSDFYLRTDNREFLFPVFKFLSSSHADKLLQQGNVHIPQLLDFQNADKYDGKILDQDEGLVTIRNHYTSYKGLAKNANGLLPMHFRPYEMVETFNQTIDLPFQSSAYAYCITQHFFSDSLQWAISERNKDKCVLITDFPRFVNLVNQGVKPSVRLLDVRPCVYTGRLIDETDPSADSRSNFLLANQEWIHFIKPPDYESQRELRAIWIDSDEKGAKAINFDIPELPSICLPVTFPTIKEAITKQGVAPESLSYGARLNCKGATKQPNYKIRSPAEVCSPVLHKKPGDEWTFGFWYGRLKPRDAKIFADLDSGEAAGGVTGIKLTDIGAIFCNVSLATVESIEFYCEEKAADDVKHDVNN